MSFTRLLSGFSEKIIASTLLDKVESFCFVGLLRDANNPRPGAFSERSAPTPHGVGAALCIFSRKSEILLILFYITHLRIK